jgi:hypothetical protein
MVKYNSRFSYIPGAKSPCHLEVVDLISHTEDEWLHEAAKRTGISYAVLKAAWLGMKDVWGDWTEAGEGIKTDVMDGSPSIKGGAETIEAAFNPAVNSLQYNITAGPYLKRRMALAATEKSGSSSHGPVITGVEDLLRGTVNQSITPGYDVRVVGRRLKIDPLGEPSVITLRHEGSSTYVVPFANLLVNKPSELIFRCPNLPTGFYRLGIKTAFSGSSTPLKMAHLTYFEILLESKPLTADEEARLAGGTRPDNGETGSAEGAGI